MEFLLWFGVFVVLAILATLPVHFHLAAMRKAGHGGSQVSLAKEKKTKPCPRCQKPFPVDAAFCESCGDKNRTALDSCVRAKEVHLLLESEILEVGEGEVLINCGNGGPRRLENDYVFACLGGTSAKGFLENIGISMVTKEVMLEKSIA